MTSRIAALAFAGLAIPATVFAHHSFAAEFDRDQKITLKGSIVRMDWVNRHSWLYIEVKDDNGKVETWALEFGAPNALFRRGWRKTAVPIGATVTVTAYR